MITGKEIIELGYAPSKWFREVIEKANQENMSMNEIKAYIESVRPVHVEPFSEPINYYKNIRAESELEECNVEDVYKCMDAIMVAPTIIKGAIMPDACPTGGVNIPVGGIAVARNAIHPAMHSADICCSVMLSNFGDISPSKLMNRAEESTHFGVTKREDVLSLPKELEEEMRLNPFLNNERALNLAKMHLGTQGDGNHFLFIGKSENTGDTSMVTHHGSRGLGAFLYKSGMNCAEMYRKEISPNTHPNNAWIPYDTEDGKNYWEALQIIRKWTKLNHQLIHNLTKERANSEVKDNFWNEHNFVFKEDDLFYHAKGATPLSNQFVPDSTDGRRLIPLNMGQPILVVKGDTNENNLGFAPHGAGRNQSRSAHKRSLQEYSIREIFNRETEGLDVRFFSGKIDISELPSAYKNADQVIAQMEEFNLGTIVDKIIPYGSIMAGEQEKFGRRR